MSTDPHDPAALLELEGPPPHPDDAGAWHRRLCPVVDADGRASGIVLSGDLHEDPEVAAAQLDRWVLAGIGTIVDCRVEWSDERFVAARHPQLTYVHVGVDDDGGRQADEWFDEGVAAGLAALERGDTVLAHCHMGINRGPSMGLAVLLARGWSPFDALFAIQQARPIAGIIYAEDAVDWFVRREGGSAADVSEARADVAAWQAEHGIDVYRVIRRMRSA